MIQPAPLQRPKSTPSESLESRRRRAEEAWRTLGHRLRAVSPSHLVRLVMASGAVVGLGWLIVNAWEQLLPFQLGFVLAYVTLPLVNKLDMIMPRWLAASLVVVLELVSIVVLIALLVPPLFGEATLLVQSLPSLSELDQRLDALRARLATLPEPTQVLIRDGVDGVVSNVRGNLGTYIQSAAGVLIAGVLGIFNTFGFLIGFLGIPTWLVTVLSDNKMGTRAINRLLPTVVQPDVWAVLRIIDRVFSVHVRGQLLLGLVVAVLTYAGLQTLIRLEIIEPRYSLILALIAGMTQLIPIVGPILGTIPAVLLMLPTSPEAAVAVLLLYVGIQFFVNAFLAQPIAGRYVDIHPALFVIVLVALSQFGLLWVVLAAPLSVVARDLFRYAYGRFGDPPRPAGLLPGATVPHVQLRRVHRESAANG